MDNQEGSRVARLRDVADDDDFCEVIFDNIQKLGGIAPGAACSVMVLRELIAHRAHPFRSALMRNENLTKSWLLSCAEALDEERIDFCGNKAVEQARGDSFKELMESESLLDTIWSDPGFVLYWPQTGAPVDEAGRRALAQACCLSCEDTAPQAENMDMYVKDVIHKKQREMNYVLITPPKAIRMLYRPKTFSDEQKRSKWDPRGFSVSWGDVEVAKIIGGEVIAPVKNHKRAYYNLAAAVRLGDPETDGDTIRLFTLDGCRRMGPARAWPHLPWTQGDSVVENADGRYMLYFLRTTGPPTIKKMVASPSLWLYHQQGFEQLAANLEDRERTGGEYPNAVSSQATGSLPRGPSLGWERDFGVQSTSFNHSSNSSMRNMPRRRPSNSTSAAGSLKLPDLQRTGSGLSERSIDSSVARNMHRIPVSDSLGSQDDKSANPPRPVVQKGPTTRIPNPTTSSTDNPDPAARFVNPERGRRMGLWDEGNAERRDPSEKEKQATNTYPIKTQGKSASVYGGGDGHRGRNEEAERQYEERPEAQPRVSSRDEPLRSGNGHSQHRGRWRDEPGRYRDREGRQRWPSRDETLTYDEQLRSHSPSREYPRDNRNTRQDERSRSPREERRQRPRDLPPQEQPERERRGRGSESPGPLPRRAYEVAKAVKGGGLLGKFVGK